MNEAGWILRMPEISISFQTIPVCTYFYQFLRLIRAKEKCATDTCSYMYVHVFYLTYFITFGYIILLFSSFLTTL